MENWAFVVPYKSQLMQTWMGALRVAWGVVWVEGRRIRVRHNPVPAIRLDSCQIEGVCQPSP